VYAVVALDTAQTAFAVHNAWQVLGSGWGNPVQILDPEWSWGSVPLFTGLGVSLRRRAGIYHSPSQFSLITSTGILRNKNLEID